MRFGIDLDGVVCDFNEAFNHEVNMIWPGRLPLGYEPPDWNYGKDLSSADIDRVWKVIENKPNWWLGVKAYGDNVRAITIHRIRHPEDEIFFVTARHEVAGMPTMHQSQTWLSQCGINGLGIGVIVDRRGDKSSIFNALGCDANIDDKLEAVIDHTKQTKGAFLLDRPWNRENRQSDIRVVSNLEEFFRRANARI